MDSTSKVSFYKIPGETLADKLTFACRLAEKVVSLEHSVFILATSHEQLKKLDEKLWTFSSSSFVPHGFQNTETHEGELTIGTELPSNEHADILINLKTTPFANPNQFNRITEIVIQDESQLASARKRFRSYQELGLTPMMVPI